MRATFKQYEIDHHVLKLIVGLIAVTLPFFAMALAGKDLTSISASYHADDMARNVFVGFLFAISSFLLAYNGEHASEWFMSKIAALAALGVALCPCACGCRKEDLINTAHIASAAAMFLVLAGMCVVFYRRARAKQHRQANWRASIYAACGAIIIASIALIGLDAVLADKAANKDSALVLYCETAGLVAFGIAWMVASRTLPLITTPEERTSVLPYRR
ncbi:hypothetical protein D0B54_03845 [Solimonas sp. K1W22B-7]|uniref:hypothetical protein n=1 Tax=Solimonas sp. K1W22B-7 TaxID=2303331 RepID=UPI000E337245|nr:hypothetical protein [Solimonas sp. K1W22B-7]AXQ27861.1 hypothetical protein D0B54_03845 [Solimonas sp. K1W22B-7]